MSLYTKEQINEIKSKIDYYEWYKQYVPDLTIRGKSAWGNCPFHTEQKPSFQIDIETGLWVCWGENLRGDCFSFYQKFHCVSFNDSVQQLAEQFGVELQLDQEEIEKREYIKKMYQVNDFMCTKYVEQLHRDNNAWNYLINIRGLSPKIINDFKIGCGINKLPEKESLKTLGILAQGENEEWYSKLRQDRVIFPRFDEYGNILGFTGRLCVEKDGAKYMHTPNTVIHDKSKHVFGLYQSKKYIKHFKSVICVEGNLDMIMCFQKGIVNTVALDGLNISDAQINLLKKYTNVFYLVLEDGAMLRGEKDKTPIDKFYTKVKENIPYAKVYIVDLRNEDGSKCDADEFLQTHTREEFQDRVKNAKIYNEFIVNNTLKTMKPKNIEETTACINALIPRLSNISNFLDRKQYIELVSNKLNIPENLIYKKIKFFNEKQEKLNSQNITWDSKPIYAQKILLSICLAPYFNNKKALLNVMLYKGCLQDFYRKLLEDYISPYILNQNVENVNFSDFFSEIMYDKNISDVEKNILTDSYMKVEQLEDFDNDDLEELIQEQIDTLNEYVYTDVQVESENELENDLKQELEALSI